MARLHRAKIMQITFRCHIVLLLIALLTTTAHGGCQLEERTGQIFVSGYFPKHITHNVCVDGTVITPLPNRESSRAATYARECCGCRVSSYTERELRMDSFNGHITVYYPDVRVCQCIPCDTSRFSCANLFTTA